MYKYILIIIAIFLVGCSPKYVIKNHYIPASSFSFNQCSDTCSQDQQLCQTQCNANYEVCLNNSYQRAQEIFDGQFSDYENNYNNYLIQLKHYQQNRYRVQRTYDRVNQDYHYFENQCRVAKSRYACERQNDLRYQLVEIRKDMFDEPRRPYKPLFETTLKKQQSLCPKTCSCDKIFDVCYTNCGGEVIPYKFCIENCD